MKSESRPAYKFIVIVRNIDGLFSP